MCLPTLHRAGENVPSLIPTDTQNAHRASDGLSRLQQVDRKTLKHLCESTALLSPRNVSLLHAMLWALHPRNPRVKNRFELAAVQMTPLTDWSMMHDRNRAKTDPIQDSRTPSLEDVQRECQSVEHPYLA